MGRKSRSQKINLENANQEKVKANRAVKKARVHPVQMKRSVAVPATQVAAVILSNDHRQLSVNIRTTFARSEMSCANLLFDGSGSVNINGVTFLLSKVMSKNEN